MTVLSDIMHKLLSIFPVILWKLLTFLFAVFVWYCGFYEGSSGIMRRKADFVYTQCKPFPPSFDLRWAEQAQQNRVVFTLKLTTTLFSREYSMLVRAHKRIWKQSLTCEGQISTSLHLGFHEKWLCVLTLVLLTSRKILIFCFPLTSAMSLHLVLMNLGTVVHGTLRQHVHTERRRTSLMLLLRKLSDSFLLHT